MQVFLRTAAKCQNEIKKQRTAKLTEVFAVFDFDNSGAIEAKELLRLGKAKDDSGDRVWESVGMDGEALCL